MGAYSGEHLGTFDIRLCLGLERYLSSRNAHPGSAPSTHTTTSNSSPGGSGFRGHHPHMAHRRNTCRQNSHRYMIIICLS